ncbi:MAG: DUF4288 domain-containing protein [Gammaproteobacteria bacterium]|nr:DUF4288 domain-containing protein [Gammaproteobacteria bacterium]
MADHKLSPFNWYSGSYLVSFNLCDQQLDQDLHKHFDGWEVSVTVFADSMEQAYDKIVEVAERDTHKYVGELGGENVEWQFRGVTELDPLLTDLDHSSDIYYVDHQRIKCCDQKVFIRSKQALCE